VDAGGQPQRLLAIWPADQARLIDTWDGLGLRGTGSGDFEISDLFVPDDQVNAGFYSKPAYDRALFRMKRCRKWVTPPTRSASPPLPWARSWTQSTPSPPGSTRHMAMGHMQAHQIAVAGPTS